MSRISHWLNHRAAIKRLNQTNVDGAPSYNWTIAQTNFKCRLDLAKSSVWTPEIGRPPDRVGQLFCEINANVQPGDRIQMTKGPTGTFQIDGLPDEPWDFSTPSHWEFGVSEVAQQPQQA